MIQQINLNPKENVLQGRINPQADIVTVLCDAADSSFSVSLPDANTGKRVQFQIKKTDSTTNTITFNTVQNQYIDSSGTTSYIVSQTNSIIELVTDNNNYYNFHVTLLDEDDFASDSAAYPATQQSIKAYVDAAVVGTSLYSFKTITGITNNVVADKVNDSLTLASGNNILGIVGTTATDTITFTIDETKINHDNLSSRTHDGDTLQHDGINSDGGEFPFATSDTITFTVNSTDVLSLSNTDATFGDGIGVNLYEDLTFLGATGENEIIISTNLADALSIHDGVGDLMVFTTTTGSQKLTVTLNTVEAFSVLPYSTEMKNAANNASCRISTYSDGGHYSYLKLKSSYTDTLDSNVATIDTQTIGAIRFTGIDTAPGERNAAQIKCVQSEDATATQVPARLDFYTDSITGSATRFHIDRDQNISAFLDLYIDSDSKKIFFGDGQGSCLHDDGSDMYVDFDIQNTTGRSLIIQENAVTKATFNTNGLLLVGAVGIGSGAVGAPGWYFTADTDVGAYYTANQINWAVCGAQAAYLNSTGFAVDRIGLAGAAPNSKQYFLDITDATLSATDDVIGVNVILTKTAGASDKDDNFYGGYFLPILNQNGVSIGNFRGLFGGATLIDGEVGSNGNAKNMQALYFTSTVVAGTVWGDSYGLQVANDLQGGTIKDDAYGAYIKLNANATIDGTSYTLFLKEVNSPDYGLFQDGTAQNWLGGQLTIDTDSGGTIYGDSQAVHLFYDGANFYFRQQVGTATFIFDGYTDVDTNCMFYIIAGEACDAIVNYYADEGDNNADKWRTIVDATNNYFSIESRASGSWVGNLYIETGGGIHTPNMASGANQGAAGAIAGELWHDTTDNTVKMGV